MTPSHGLDAVICAPSATMRDALQQMSRAAEYGLPVGVVLICSSSGELAGIVTDGDVRRALIAGQSLDDAVDTFMRPDPITFMEGMSYSAVLNAIPTVLAERGRYRTGVMDRIVMVDETNRPTRLLNLYQLWEHQIVKHRHIVVSGLGYVGLTLALVLAEHDLKVTGVEIDPDIRASLQAGEPHFHEVGLASLLRDSLKNGFTIGSIVPEDGDVFVITVGTPLDTNGEPTLRFLEEAAASIGERLRPGCLVVLRSTVPVGTSRDVVLPVLERISGLTGGVDFHLAFAPERTVEGNALHELRSLPQVVGGLTPNCVDVAAALFASVTPTVVRVGSLEESEMTKLANNGFRDLTFAFANEMAQICAKYNIDPHRVVNAANQGYPRDPIPLPSPGVGGLCLQKDPYILGFIAKQAGMETPLSIVGRRVNEMMPRRVVEWLEGALRIAGKDLTGATILLLGMAFKGHPETSDVRGSISVEIAEDLLRRGVALRVHDPIVREKDLAALGASIVDMEEGFAGADAVLLLNNHRSYARLELAPLVSRMNIPAVVFDGWGLIDPDTVRAVGGVVYQRLGFTQ